MHKYVSMHMHTSVFILCCSHDVVDSDT